MSARACRLSAVGDTTLAGGAEGSHAAPPAPPPAPRPLVALPPLAHVVAWAAALLDAHFVGLATQPAGRTVRSAASERAGERRPRLGPAHRR